MAPPSADHPPSGPFVATVAGHRIFVARLEERAAEVRRGPRGRHLPPGRVGEWGPEWQGLRRWMVQELVTDEVLAHEARLAGVLDRVDLVERVTAGVSVSEADMRAYYGRNGDLYRRLEVRRGELTGPLEDAIFGAALGAIVGPIRTEHGWHVARVEDISAPSVVPYAEARSAIEGELLTAARSRAFDAWLESRRKALAVVEPEFAHPGDPVHGMPSHRH